MNLASLHTFKDPLSAWALDGHAAVESGRPTPLFLPYFIANTVASSPALEQTPCRSLYSLETAQIFCADPSSLLSVDPLSTCPFPAHPHFFMSATTI